MTPARVPARLGDDAIAVELAATPGWERRDDTIVRTYRFGSFKEAVFFVNAVAALAEHEDHHPDITIAYSTVTLSLSTHVSGGITARDFDLARKIDEAIGP
jgi:4a-hydroxytetrahydrobiopterin dehydratase